MPRIWLGACRALLILGIAIVAAHPSFAQNAPVPNVVGKDLNTALRELTAAGFVVGTEFGTPVPRGDARLGKIEKTSPEPGKQAAKGSKVQVWLWREAAGAPAQNVTVPNVVGKDSATAMRELQAAGFAVSTGNSTEVPQGDPRVGKVSKTLPEPGQLVAKGRTVNLWTYKAAVPAMATVPNVMGKKLAVAFGELQAAGFQIGQRGSNGAVPMGDPRGGTVNKMEPAAGAPAPKGSKVDIWVLAESGPPPAATTVKVPNIVGMDYGSTTALLNQAGLQIFDFSCAFENAAQKNKVAHQHPSPGTEVKKGTYVGRAFYGYQASPGVKAPPCLADPNRMPKQ